MARDDTPSGVSGRRVEWLTLGLGAAAAIAVGPHWGWEASLGLAVGALLSWINFRWLKQGVSGIFQSSLAQNPPPNSRVAQRTVLKFLGRFVLLAVVLYVILSRSLLPAGAVVAGLFAAVAAVLIEMVYLLVTGWRRPQAN